MYKSPNASIVMSSPITIPILANPLIFHFAGLCDHFTLSVDRAILTKSVMKIIINKAVAVITNFPSTRKATTTKQVFKIVLAILFNIHVLMRSNIILPTLMGPSMFTNPSCVKTILAAPLATSVALLTAIPTSACFNAGASFTPSPVMPTICPFAWNTFTISYLSFG